MKIYVLYKEPENKIIALSESKEYVYKYILQNNFGSEYKVSKIKDRNLIDKFLIVYDELILDETEGFILTAIERRLINRNIEESKCKIEDTIEAIETLLSNFNFSEKDYVILRKAVKVLYKNTKPKRLSKLLSLKEFIMNLFLPSKKDIVDSFRNEIQMRDNNYYIYIDIDDD